jgi:hypothetical protein
MCEQENGQRCPRSSIVGLSAGVAHVTHTDVGGRVAHFLPVMARGLSTGEDVLERRCLSLALFGRVVTARVERTAARWI